MSEVVWPSVERVPPRMRAVTLREFGPPEVLRVETVPTPAPARGEVLLRVAAVSVGRLLDLVARSGRHPYARFRFPHILGAEHAGVVAALGEGVTELAVGDRVGVFQVVLPVEDAFTRAGRADLSPSLQIIGTHRPGAYAEYSLVPARNATKVAVAADLDPAQVAALAGVGPVATNQFAQAGGVRAGTRVVVLGASSGLGSTTALLARRLGAVVVAASRDETKRERLRGLSLEHVLDPSAADFVERARAVFEGRGAHLVVDDLGAPDLFRHGLETLAPNGVLVSSGAFLGPVVPLDLQRLYSNGLRVIGVRTGTFQSAAELWRQVAGGFRTVVDRAFLLEEAAQAHRYLESSENVGRVVLVP